MVKSTQIFRLDGLPLAASVDDEQAERDLTDIKSKVKQLLRRLSRTSETQASIESGPYTVHYLISPPPSSSSSSSSSSTASAADASLASTVFLCICDASYPRKLAFTYLSDIASEFSTTYAAAQIASPSLRPYAFVEFDTFIQRARKTYQNPQLAVAAAQRGPDGLDRLNGELKDVTKVMTKNIEDLLYRGDSLERMGELSGRLKEDSRKYRKAAVRINWELLLKQVSPRLLGGRARRVC